MQAIADSKLTDYANLPGSELMIIGDCLIVIRGSATLDYSYNEAVENWIEYNG